MSPRQSDISQIKIGQHIYGIVGLKHALEALGETHAKQPDEAVAEELLRRLSNENYIPDKVREKYGRAFVREFRKYLGQAFVEEKSEGLEIKVLGAGCTVCDGLENQIMEAFSKTGFRFNFKEIGPKDIFEMASNNLEVKLWKVVVVAEAAAGPFRSAANLSSLFIMPMVAGLEINLFPMAACPPNAGDVAPTLP